MITRGAQGIACGLLLLTGACTVKESPPADSVSLSVSPAAAVESTTVAGPPVSAGTPAATGKKGQAPPPDTIMGRDSAFGPIGTIDSLGNVRPIPKK